MNFEERQYAVELTILSAGNVCLSYWKIGPLHKNQTTFSVPLI